LLRGRAKVGATRGRRVIALLACRRWPGLKIGRVGKSLRDQLGADDLSLLIRHQAAVGSPGEERLSESGDHEGIKQSSYNKSDDGLTYGDSECFDRSVL